MSRVFTNGLGDWGSIPGRIIPMTKKKKKKKKKKVVDFTLLNTQHYKVNIEGIEKRAFRSPLTKVANFTYYLLVITASSNLS